MYNITFVNFVESGQAKPRELQRQPTSKGFDHSAGRSNPTGSIATAVRKMVPVTMSQKLAVTAMAVIVMGMASRVLLPQALAALMQVTLFGFGGQHRNLLHGAWGW